MKVKGTGMENQAQSDSRSGVAPFPAALENPSALEQQTDPDEAENRCQFRSEITLRYEQTVTEETKGKDRKRTHHTKLSVNIVVVMVAVLMTTVLVHVIQLLAG